MVVCEWRIINGTANYYIEEQTKDARRTDVIVEYLGGQFIVELKIWYGSEYNERKYHILVKQRVGKIFSTQFYALISVFFPGFIIN